MERMKSLRHPFLLSLERIEIVENRLFIVTELADGSLRDRFRECQATGLPGIPRDELLHYLSNAADALDFLCDQSELQHLDVKPENLLLVAGHVKVADFGLVKDIHSTQASLVGGMTPSYAAPELFQGCPTRHSDQYSLAILFQEMLTGTLPFQGATAAELTLQHINGSPQLESLSEGDRFTLSQALSKEADHRFPSCRDLVKALRSRSLADSSAAEDSTETPAADGPAHSVSRFKGAVQPPASHSVTQVFDEDQASWSEQSKPVLFDLPEMEPCQQVSPPDFHAEEVPLTPSVVIGLGGTAASVMRALREKVANSLGNEAEQSVIEMLLIDTDASTISAAVRESDEGPPLAPQETLCAALRRPQDYRNDSSRLLRWISRRWLYNIPKSLLTGGIRPLGRLAMVDHARQVCQRIRLVLQQAVDPERLAEIETSTGIRFQRDAVRVYLVGSISGGTGSGMMLDVAYLVRASLDRMELDEKRLLGIAAHSTSRDAEKGELGRVNAFAWLAELDYLSQPEVAYPGDDSAGLPRHDASVRPFDDAYLVNMGERLAPAMFSKQTSSIADYLFVDMLTPGQQVLDTFRKIKPDDDSGSGTPLRTFALRRTTRLSPEASHDWASLIRQRLLESWCGQSFKSPSAAAPTSDKTPGSTSTGKIVRGAAQFVGQHPIDVAGLAALGRTGVEKKLGGNALRRLRQAIQEAGYSPDTLTREKGVELFNGLIPCESLSKPQHWRIAGQRVSTVAAEVSERLANDLTRWILERCNLPQERLPSAERAVEWFRDHLQSLSVPLEKMRRSLASQSSAILETSPPESKDEIGRQIVRLWKLRIDQAAIGVACQVVIELARTLDSVSERLGSARKGFQAILADSPSAKEVSEKIEVPVGPWIARWITELDQQLTGNLVDEEGRFVHLSHEPEGNQHFADRIQREAEELVSQSPTLHKMAAQNAGMASLGEESETLSNALHPYFDSQGGEYCHLLLTPECNDSLENNPMESLGAVRIATSLPDAYCVAEAWGLSVLHVAAELVGGRHDYAQLASRVHSRQDIEWPCLIDNLAPEEVRVAESEVLSTQVLALPSESMVRVPNA